MAISDVIIAEMMEEAAATKRVFERLPEDKMGWKPHQKSRTLGQLALHIARVPAGVTNLSVPDQSEIPAFEPNEPQAKNKKELLQILEEGLESAKQMLKKMDDQTMMNNITFQKEGKEIFTAPRMAFLRNVLLNHNYHHRGQLTVYLRLLDIPVPSVYGPSADENPFAG